MGNVRVISIGEDAEIFEFWVSRNQVFWPVARRRSFLLFFLFPSEELGEFALGLLGIFPFSVKPSLFWMPLKTVNENDTSRTYSQCLRPIPLEPVS
jgi:hypothetical protein